ncbi:uncharacterized protein [Parasteatoda tepidariorum]|uniref:uncharacterized protein isoform X2 n=1 Tax=Parasteatoda tepidariorum TaxID=114398 RepID=UPI00077FB931|nr:GATA zinc finger domain-containing protein 14 isoform X2 [Parasteatoda tepidariorum]
MKYFFWLVKEIIVLLFVTYIYLHPVDGRRYDKCETPDGRQGVCVVKRYCREATFQSLEACDNDDNFCCPITTHRSAKPPIYPISEPHNTRNDDIPKSVRNASHDSDHRSVIGDQRPVYGHANPERDSLPHIPTDSHKVLSSSSGGNRRNVTSYHNSEEPKSTRNENPPKNVPNESPDDRRSMARDSYNGNERPVNGRADSGADSSPNVPINSHRVPSSSSGSNRQTVTSHRNPEEPRSTRNENPPKIVPNASPDSDRRSVPRDSYSGNQRPVYGHANSETDSLPNVPVNSHRVPSFSNDGNRQTTTSHSNPDEDSSKSVPNASPNTDDRSKTRDFPSGNQRGSNQQPVSSHHNPEDDFQPDMKENRKRTIISEHSVNKSYIPTQGGRVKFEDAEHLFNDRNNKNRRLKPLSSNSNVKPSVEPSEKDSHNRQNSAGPDSATNNRNVNPGPLISTFGHYPSVHQLEVQKLPSNPRRLKPFHNEENNDTFDGNVRHTFYPHTQPKVPACGVKPYDLFIAGGETSEAYEWPWMTSIFRRHQGSRPKTFLCGGSLINSKYVLTAAHCFVNNYVVLPASSFVIRLGSHFLDSGEEYTVSDLVIHHNHSGSDFFNDIALVKIASEVYITDKIAPICLPTPDMISEDFVDRIATVAGWGDTTFRTGSSRALQHVTIPIVSGDECFAAYSRVRGAAFLARGSDHVICAGLREGGKDACLGDSGGPLMLKTVDDRWIIVGIVSLGYKCAEPGYPGVYTRVTHYLTWIHANMKPH